MNIKLKAGKIIGNSIDKLVELNYKLVPYIPNGRILPLDIKRAHINPKVIFDAGANIGQSSNYFISHFPDADIYSFEPVPATYQQLISNVTNTKRIHCFNQGLGAAEDDVVIYKSHDNGFSSINGADDARFLSSETVHITTGYNFCKQYNIETVDLLKIDTEGYELEVLKGFEPLLKNNVKMIYTEVGFAKNDNVKTYISDLLDFLTDFGFHTSNFYEPYRYGKNKLHIGYYNMLLINTNLVQ